ncbi:MAG: VCBS repeat-containing protein, partial [Balneolaceae bacterium]
HLDILYTNGDNADFSKVYKPYHGVSVYLNDGNDSFTQEWFYPVNGAYRAVARDFNKNGRLDIAVISYFADYIRSPEEGFLFFKNDGGLEFTPYHHPAAKAGRWLTMDVADWTGDGYEDIVLGSFPFGPSLASSPFRLNWEDSPHFLLLENKLKE